MDGINGERGFGQLTTLRGVDQLVKNLRIMKREYGKGVAKASFLGGQIVRTAAIKSIQKRSNGGKVRRSRQGGKPYDHIVSRAGDAPNTDTGDLVKSINVEVNPDVVRVGTNQKHGKHLEFGTRKMDARPWLLPALKKSGKKINKLFVDEIVRTTHKGVGKK